MTRTTLEITDTGSPFAIRLRYGDREAVAEVPFHRLADSGLESKLASGALAGMAEAADTYRRQLLTAFVAALEEMPELGVGVRVIVRGAPALHATVWETLRLDQDGAATGCEVLRIPPITRDDAVPEGEPREGRLTWIGSRAAGEADVGRYRVLGGILPMLLGSGSAITLRALRTDARLDELPALLEIDSGKRAPIVHLDAHGLSAVEAATEGLIDEVFAFWVRGENGPTLIRDSLLLESLPAAGCELFTTNGCFSGQQRGVLELPFPAQLVQRGVQAAIGAREPLEVGAAGIFFVVLYGQLAAGTPLGAAFAAACSELAGYARVAADQPGEVPDRSALFALQPVLWLTDAYAADHCFVRQQAAAAALPAGAGEMLGMTMAGGTASALARAVEDIILDGAQGAHVELAPGAGWDLANSQAAADTLAAAVSGRPAGLPPAYGDSHARLQLGDASDTEHALMVERFAGPHAIRWLLAGAIPARAGWLDSLAEAHERDAGRALLAALAWGGPPFDGDERVRDLLLEHRADLASRNAVGNCSEGVREFLLGMASLPLALPVSAGRGESFLGLAVPDAVGAGPLIATAFSGVAGTLGRAEPTVVCLPYRTTQLIARAETPPRAVMALRAREILKGNWSRPRHEPFGGPLRRQICLTWLALAVAARQVGMIDPTAIDQALPLVGREDVTAAALLAEYLRDGLPEWEPLKAPMISIYADIAAERRTYADAGDKEYSDTPGDRALRALKRRETEGVFEILREEELRTFEERKVTAYALARTGKPSEARALVLPDVRAMAKMSRFDRCELLHLLAHIAELDGQRELAIQHMLEERALDPPRSDVRLHNRIHLLDLLAEERSDPDLHVALAAEALPLAVELQRTTDLLKAVLILVVFTLMHHEHRLAATVELIESHPAARDLVPTRLARAVLAVRQGVPTSQVKVELRDLAEGDDWTAAEACTSLAAISDQPDERREWLIRAGTTRGRSYEHAVRALDELWDEGADDALKQLADSIADDWPATVAVVRAALNERRGSAADAQAVLASAFVEHGLYEIHVLMVKLACGAGIAPETEAAARADGGAELIGRVSRYLKGESTVDAMHALHRLRGYAETTRPEQPEDHAGNGAWFIRASEQLWDRDELEAAAQARRIACRFYEVASATTELAMQLGWLATLEKQLGRTAAAEALYQRAVALGEEHLSVQQLGSLIGRYAGLLHQLGQRQAAVMLQWRATCLRSASLDRDEPLTEAALRELPAREPDVELSERMNWLLQLANLANCLLDTARPDLAHMVLAPAEVRFRELAASATADDAKHARAAAEMLIRVRHRLGLLQPASDDPGAV